MYQSPSDELKSQRTSDVIPEEDSTTFQDMPMPEKKNKTPPRSAIRTPVATPTPRVTKKDDLGDLSKKLAKSTISGKIQTTSTFVDGVEELLVVPMLLWVYKRDLQEFCKVQLHLPSGWTESELQSYTVEDSPNGDNTRLQLEFLQLRGFHSTKRLTNDMDEENKKIIREGPLYQSMSDHIQDTLVKSDCSVKVGRVQRIIYRVICDLPFPVESKCHPEILSFEHDFQPEKEEQYFNAEHYAVDPFEDEWPCLEIFDVDLESLDKPTCLKTKAVRRSRVKGRLFDDDESP